MTWPTEPGWYWMRDWCEDVERVTVAQAHSTQNGVAVTCEGEILYRGVSGPQEFLGPLAPPWAAKFGGTKVSR